MTLKSLTVPDHEAARGKRWYSRWRINQPVKATIRVQKFKGRLYLVGGVVRGMKWVLPFEMPVATLNRTPGIEFTRV